MGRDILSSLAVFCVRPGDYFVSLDLTNGYYTLGIREEDRDFFTVNFRWQALAPRVPPDGQVGVRLLFLQAHAGVHQLLATGACSGDRQDCDTIQTVATLPSQRPLARRAPTTLHGRLYVHGQLARGRSTSSRPRRDPTTPARPPTQPRQRPMGTHTCGQPPRPNNRPHERRISSPRRQAPSPLQTSVVATRPRCDYRSLATRLTNRGIRGNGTVALPRHRASPFLSSRTPLRTCYTAWMGLATPDDASAQTRPRVLGTVPDQHNGRSIYKPIETSYLHADSSGYG
jgi:hypothetical protein